MNRAQCIEILLVEDNPGDVRLTREALEDAKVVNEIHVVTDGIEALDFLHQRGDYANESLPHLILLDLNLPRKDGREVLTEIKNDDHLKNIPVVVLTGSEAEEDIIKAYELNVNCYVSKPVELEEFLRVVRVIQDFWLTIVKLPHC